MAQETNQTQVPMLCTTGCGFYGNPRTNGMCSVCYKEHLQRQQNGGRMSPLGASSTSSSSDFTQVQRSENFNSEDASINTTVKSRSVSGSSLPVTQQMTEMSISQEKKDTEIEVTEPVVAEASPSVPDTMSREEEKPVDVPRPKKNRCFQCRKKVGLADSDLSMRTLSTPSPALICPLNVQSIQNGQESSTSSSSVTGETTAMIHSQSVLLIPQGAIRPASRQQKEQSPIDNLPDQTLIEMFSHLPTNQLCRCTRVCRRWYNLCWDPRLWRTIRLTEETVNVDRALRVLTRRLCQDTPNVCLTLEKVILQSCRRLSDRGLYTIAQCCPELRQLEMPGCYNISNEALYDVVSRCPNLEYLDVSEILGPNTFKKIQLV